jgi:hypothetical protein
MIQMRMQMMLLLMMMRMQTPRRLPARAAGAPAEAGWLAVR